MAKDLQWNVEISGETYQVKCVPQKSLFDVYVNEDLAIRVPRKMKNDDSDSEYDLTIGGKRCQFVVYDGKPDLCVDGILLGAQRELDYLERRSKRRRLFAGMALILASTYATFLWFVYQMAGTPFFGGYVALFLFIALVFVGIGLLLSVLKKKDRPY